MGQASYLVANLSIQSSWRPIGHQGFRKLLDRARWRRRRLASTRGAYSLVRRFPVKLARSSTTRCLGRAPPPWLIFESIWTLLGYGLHGSVPSIDSGPVHHRGPPRPHRPFSAVGMHSRQHPPVEFTQRFARVSGFNPRLTPTRAMREAECAPCTPALRRSGVPSGVEDLRYGC
jgi:hypothetical protein